MRYIFLLGVIIKRILFLEICILNMMCIFCLMRIIFSFIFGCGISLSFGWMLGDICFVYCVGILCWEVLDWMLFWNIYKWVRSFCLLWMMIFLLMKMCLYGFFRNGVMFGIYLKWKCYEILLWLIMIKCV